MDAGEDSGDMSGMPDHGYGPLGRVVHGLLLAGAPRGMPPVLAMIYNTLPDAPGPPRYLEFTAFPELWQALGADLPRYLTALATGVRDVPAPDPDEWDDEPDGFEPTRLDGLAVVYYAAAMRTRTTGAGKALAANMAEGYYRRGDIAASPEAERMLMSTAVDRDGNSLLFSSSAETVGPAVSGPPGSYRVQGPVIDTLADLLAAFWSVMERVDAATDE